MTSSRPTIQRIIKALSAARSHIRLKFNGRDQRCPATDRRKDSLLAATNWHEQRERLRFYHHRFGRGWRHFGLSPCAEWQENSVNRARPLRAAREGQLEFARSKCRRQIQHKGALAECRRDRTASAYELLRWRQYEILRRSPFPPARTRFWRDQTLWRHFTRLAGLV